MNEPAKIKHLKNPIFIKNCTDPINNYKVKSIWVHKIMKDTQFKKNREKWDLKWQYYRDRNRTSIETFYKQNKGKIIKITYFGDPIQYETYLKLNESDAKYDEIFSVYNEKTKLMTKNKDVKNLAIQLKNKFNAYLEEQRELGLIK